MANDFDISTYRPYARMDVLALRVLVLGCLISFLGALSTYHLFPNHETACLWTMVGALGIGLAASLAYLLHLLWKHLQLSLLSWLMLFVLHAAMMTCVIAAPGWLGSLEDGTFAGVSASWALNTLLLAAALAALLLTESVAALLSAEWLPSFCVQIRTVERTHGIFRKEDMHFPKLGVWVLYAVSPFALWVGLQCVYYLWVLKRGQAGLQALLMVCATVLLVRGLLAAWVLLNVGLDHRSARRAGHKDHARRLGWLLFRNGLPAAWLLSFYAFSWLGTRTQQEALAQQLRTHASVLKDQLAALVPPAVPAGENAHTLYEQAMAQATPVTRYRIFHAAWDSPYGVEFIEKNQAMLQTLRKAARRERYAPPWDGRKDLNAYARTKSLNLADALMLSQALMLEGRWAAMRGDYRRLLDNTEAALTWTGRQGQGPLAVEHLTARVAANEAEMTLLAAMLFPRRHAPSDADLAEAQQIIQTHRNSWHGLAARITNIEVLQECYSLDSGYGDTYGTWTASVEPESLLYNQPLAYALGRATYLNAMKDLFRLSGPRVDAAALEKWKATYASPATRAFYPWGTYSPLDVLANMSLYADCESAMVEAALGALRYRRAKGQWPETLEACVPKFMKAVPLDPYMPSQGIGWDAHPPRVYTVGSDGESSSATHHHLGPTITTLDPMYLEAGGYFNNTERVLYLTHMLNPYTQYDALPYGDLNRSGEERWDSLMRQIQMTIFLMDQGTVRNLLEPATSNSPHALRGILFIGNKAQLLQTLQAAAWFGPAARELTPDLAPLLKASDTTIRLWALYAIGRVGPTLYDPYNEPVRDALRGWQMVTPGDPYEQWYLDVARRRFLKEEATAGR